MLHGAVLLHSNCPTRSRTDRQLRSFPWLGLILGAWLGAAHAADGTEAAPANRNGLNTAAAPGDMPPGRFTPPPPDWTYLERTRRVLTTGGELRLLALGDSIVNDTMRSGWVALLQAAYPKAEITATVYVRGGGGCQHYQEEERIARNVVSRRPHLVFIGGISQRSIEDIREVVRQLRADLPDLEILLASGTFGTTDPRAPEALAKAPHSGTGAYGRALQQLGAEERCAYLDMTRPWAEYIRSSGLHPHRFYRDIVHANEYGEQILAKILMAFFAPASEIQARENRARSKLLRRSCRIAYYPGPHKIRYLADLSTRADQELAQSVTGGIFFVRPVGATVPLCRRDIAFDSSQTAHGLFSIRNKGSSR